MFDSIRFRYVGLDVHAESITIAVADEGREAAQLLGEVPNDFSSLSKVLHRLGPAASVHCCYEAGPTGFGLARQLFAAGWGIAVIAPSLIPTKQGCRVKTNRRDAAKLAHFLRSGDLTIVHVPDEDTEAIRDLSRARAAAKQADAWPASNCPSSCSVTGGGSAAEVPGARYTRPGFALRLLRRRLNSVCWRTAWQPWNWPLTACDDSPRS